MKESKENQKVEIDKAIICEEEELNAKKNELYFRGTSLVDMICNLELILNQASTILFKVAFKNSSVKENVSLIGLTSEQWEKILSEKAEFFKCQERLQKSKIQQALTKRHSRVSYAFGQELEATGPSPEGKNFIIWNREFVLIKEGPPKNE